MSDERFDKEQTCLCLSFPHACPVHSRVTNNQSAIDVLRELVRLKELHDYIEAIAFDTMDEYRAAVQEYNREKPKAWGAARDVLAGLSSSSSQGPTQYQYGFATAKRIYTRWQEKHGNQPIPDSWYEEAKRAEADLFSATAQPTKTEGT